MPFRRKTFLLSGILTVSGLGTLFANSLPELKLIRHQYLTEAEQVRISEWFTGRENPGRRQYLRSRPTVRSGYYFVVDCPRHLRENPDFSEGAFVLQIFPGGTLRPLTYHFPLSDSASPRRPFYIGLTGPDWPGSEQRPIAWRIDLVGDNRDQPLASWQSHLWADPESASISDPGFDTSQSLDPLQP